MQTIWGKGIILEKKTLIANHRTNQDPTLHNIQTYSTHVFRVCALDETNAVDDSKIKLQQACWLALQILERYCNKMGMECGIPETCWAENQNTSIQYDNIMTTHSFNNYT